MNPPHGDRDILFHLEGDDGRRSLEDQFGAAGAGLGELSSVLVVLDDHESPRLEILV